MSPTPQNKKSKTQPEENCQVSSLEPEYGMRVEIFLTYSYKAKEGGMVSLPLS